MSCNYKTNIKDIQSKYTFKIFCAGDTSQIEQEIGNLSDLTTTAKNNLVSAINEVDGELSAKEDKSNKVTTITSSSTDTQYPSAKLLYNQLALKEDVANKTTTLSSSSTDTQYPSAKAVYDSQTEQNETISALETNLEETQEELDYYKTIYNVLPKVEGNGESITLNNTGESILKLEPRGQCKQDSTTGKNLFNGNAVSTTTPANWGVSFENNVLTIEHKNTYSTGTPTLDLGVLPSGTYVLSGTLGDRITLNRNGSYSTILASGDTFSSDGTESISLNFGNTQATTKTYKNVQVELGSTATDYEEYTGKQPSPSPNYPQQIHEVSGDNEIKVCGKNLAYMKDGTYTYAYNTGIITNNKFTLNTSGSSGAYSYFSFANGYTQQWAPEGTGVQGINDMNITSNGGNYIFTINTSSSMPSNIGFYVWTSTNRSFNTRIDGNTTKTLPISLNDNEHIKDYGIWTNNNNVFRNYELTLQLEKGETATSYEPYNGDTYEIDLGVENLLDINRTLGTPSSTSYADTTKRTFDVSKIIKGLTQNNYYDASNVIYSITDNNVVVNTSSGGYGVSFPMILEKNTTYTLSSTISPLGNYLLRISFYEEDGTYISNQTSVSQEQFITFTTPNNAYYTLLHLAPPPNIDTTYSNIQLEEGTKANSYSPYGQTPIKMRGIGTYEDYFVRNSGKNLVNLSGIGTQSSNGITITDNNDGTYTLNGTATANIVFSKSINTILQAGAYAYSLNNSAIVGNNASSSVYCYVLANETGTNWLFDRYSYQAIDSYNTGTINQNYTLNTFRIVIPNGITLNNLRIGYMIEKGSSKSIFEPYGTGKWCKYNAIGEVVLDGGDGIAIGDNSTTGDLHEYYLEPTPLKVVGQYNMICNYFTNTNANTERILGRDNNQRIFVRILNTTASNLANFKTWLSTHNTQIDYILASPYLSLIENETLIGQLDKVEKALAKQGQTNISQVNNDAPFKIYASALLKVSGE